MLQYVDAEPGIALSDERGRNGHPEAYGVKVWCLGNEMDGPWQMGFKTPEEYGRLAEETGRAMKRFDPTLELVACGSSNRGMPTFGSWERIVLDRCFDQVEMISAHAYYEPKDDDEDSFLASAEDMDRFISSVVATADHVAATKKSDKSIMISFDEWNVWFQRRNKHRSSDDHERGVYDVQDAVVVGSLLIELLRHTDRVAVACQAQLVNVLAPIMTAPGGAAWRQTIFHPFALTARHAGATVLSGAVRSPRIPTVEFGAVDQLHSVATYDEDSGEVVIFAANRSRTETLDVAVDLGGFGQRWTITEHLVLHDDDPYARNTAADPDRVLPTSGDATSADNQVRATLPPISWHCIRLAAS
jgi:alpha-N-arabinofuranosidase